MVHVTDSFASSRDQDFPELSKTFNVIASHCVLLFVVIGADGASARLKTYGVEGLSDSKRYARQSMNAEAQI
jgi:hypothetical protein